MLLMENKPKNSQFDALQARGTAFCPGLSLERQIAALLPGDRHPQNRSGGSSGTPSYPADNGYRDWQNRHMANKSREMYFAIYQAIALDERRPGLYREY
jgi:uncharacterized membrane protein